MSLHSAAADRDAEDVTRAVRGDTRAFERLYRAHVARIHSLALRMSGEDAAGDLTQEIFVRAWQRLATFRGESAFGTWLYRVAVNVILARRSAAARERARYRDPEGVLELVPARPGHGELRMDFESALRRLPEGARQVFVLHDVEGYKHEEIAGLLEISVGTSKSQLHRARNLLRGHLER